MDLVSATRFPSGPGANTDRQPTFPRSKTDEKSTPQAPRGWTAVVNSSGSAHWGLQYVLPQRLLEQRDRELVSALKRTWAYGGKKS